MEERGDRIIIAGRYLLLEVLGAGGMGVVYRALDRERGHEVALKLLHPQYIGETRAMRRFATEARAGSCVHHPNVVAVLDAETAAGRAPFLVMELVRGRLLDQLIQTEHPLPLRRASAIVGQILAGLQALHEAGFVHGDVKCGNVLVASDDAIDTVKLIDLGLASSPHEARSPPDHMTSGTPEYMAPEVVRGDGAIPVSDLYAAGVVCYELLTGTTPFKGGKAREILRRHLDDDVVPPSLRCPDREIPRALERTVLRALEKDPAARYPTAAAFARALATATPRAEPGATRGEPCTVSSVDAPTQQCLHPTPRPRLRVPRGPRARGEVAVARTRGSATASRP
jgi:serine/threonine-protein kinase